MVDLGAQWRGFWRYYGRTQGIWRELLAGLVCIAVGLLLMPCLIYLVGRAALGPYAGGNLFSLWHDFLDGLARGSHAAWFILLGPYVLLWLLRAGRRVLHKPA